MCYFHTITKKEINLIASNINCNFFLMLEIEPRASSMVGKCPVSYIPSSITDFHVKFFVFFREGGKEVETLCSPGWPQT
jgi:hypothetical protein